MDLGFHKTYHNHILFTILGLEQEQNSMKHSPDSLLADTGEERTDLAASAGIGIGVPVAVHKDPVSDAEVKDVYTHDRVKTSEDESKERQRSVVENILDGPLAAA